jgi:hypothetical protein
MKPEPKKRSPLSKKPEYTLLLPEMSEEDMLKNLVDGLKKQGFKIVEDRPGHPRP